MSDSLYLFFDLETGGLRPSESDILTGYFGLFSEDLKLIDELELKLKPDDRLPMVTARALAVNKIDIKNHLSDPETITYSQGREKLLALIKKHLKKNGRYSNLISAGFNVRFDIRFINHYLIPEEEWEGIIHYKPLDVMDHIDCLKYHGWLPKDVGSLEKSGDYFGVPEGTAHTAKDDIFRTVGLLKKVKELMDSKKNGGAAVDLVGLLEQE